jgi:hypothetical protein
VKIDNIGENSMNHSFNTQIANLYGVEEAIIIENIYFWISKNKANEKHFYDGDYWTYNSARAFTELFPYWTQRQLERILKNAELKGAIKTGNYNKVAYDRTKWYSLTDKVKSIYANGETHFTKRGNGITQSVEPIPDINTNVNTNNNNENYYSASFSIDEEIDALVNENQILNTNEVGDISTKNTSDTNANFFNTTSVTNALKTASAEILNKFKGSKILSVYKDTDVDRINCFVKSFKSPSDTSITNFINKCEANNIQPEYLINRLPDFMFDGIWDKEFQNKKSGNFAMYSFDAFKNEILFERLKNYCIK